MKGRNEDSEQHTGSCKRKRHLGVDFAVWSEGAWVWFLINPNGEGGMIGASPNEAQAMHEACLSMEEIPAVF
jgi:hypothetical protein